jgi:conjugal transfer/entry exclusion protein
MSTIKAIQVPDSLYRQVAILSEREGVSIEQFVASAIAEKAAAWAAEDYLQQRAARASREKFLRALSKVPDVEPEEHDRWD